MFSAQLREEANPVFEAIYQHPFVEGVANGQVPREALIHYVKADYEYLTAFARIYGLAVSKCETREEMAFFQSQIHFVLHSEIHPHNVFCKVAGVDYEDLQKMTPPPAADHYISHMMNSAVQGDMGELMAALLPCPWTYQALAEHIIETKAPDQNNPFLEWIMFYANNEDGMPDVTAELCKRLDKWAETAGSAAKERARKAFLKSCMLEHSFWEMAITEQNWLVPLEKGAAHV
ncbi:thiaminase II [Terribacillus sp. DMT04]|uniref:thiaminase II n=1 Tax=Terribacillus sp. DMT04 TaxID=2850441 RepID=UPI001C2BD6B4|nr:thiaminase II [Terribacillus sp. DMT04]QXE02152.1 thiaminase II [Terribacillus sp. DMT04]